MDAGHAGVVTLLLDRATQKPAAANSGKRSGGGDGRDGGGGTAAAIREMVSESLIAHAVTIDEPEISRALRRYLDGSWLSTDEVAEEESSHSTTPVSPRFWTIGLPTPSPAYLSLSPMWRASHSPARPTLPRRSGLTHQLTPTWTCTLARPHKATRAFTRPRPRHTLLQPVRWERQAVRLVACRGRLVQSKDS